MSSIVFKESFTDEVKLNFSSFLKPMADEEFLQLSRDNQDVQIETTKEGDLIIMPGTGGLTGRKNAKIIARLVVWSERDASGVAFDSDTIFRLPNGAKKIPDAAWVSNEKWNRLSKDEQDKIVPFAPDFAVELRSHTDQLKDLQEKMREYVENGVSLGWLIDAENRKIHVYRLNEEVEILENPAEISGAPPLKNFVLEMKGIWD